MHCGRYCRHYLDLSHLVEQLKEFHDVAVANGATSVEDPPGPRENKRGVLHLCYFLDLDGHKICGLHRPS